MTEFTTRTFGSLGGTDWIGPTHSRAARRQQAHRIAPVGLESISSPSRVRLELCFLVALKRS